MLAVYLLALGIFFVMGFFNLPYFLVSTIFIILYTGFVYYVQQKNEEVVEVPESDEDMEGTYASIRANIPEISRHDLNSHTSAGHDQVEGLSLQVMATDRNQNAREAGNGNDEDVVVASRSGYFLEDMDDEYYDDYFVDKFPLGVKTRKKSSYKMKLSRLDSSVLEEHSVSPKNLNFDSKKSQILILS